MWTIKREGRYFLSKAIHQGEGGGGAKKAIISAYDYGIARHYKDLVTLYQMKN